MAAGDRSWFSQRDAGHESAACWPGALVNIVLLALDVLQGNINPASGGSSRCLNPTVVAWLHLALAARIFGSDAILYGSQGSWADLSAGPTISAPSKPQPARHWCAAVVFALQTS